MVLTFSSSTKQGRRREQQHPPLTSSLTKGTSSSRSISYIRSKFLLYALLLIFLVVWNLERYDVENLSLGHPSNLLDDSSAGAASSLWMTDPSQLWKPKFDQTPHPLLLSVPFYIYEELLWDPAQSRLGNSTLQELANAGTLGKHSNDYWFIQAALHHPLRTLHPKDAKLFVIPTLTNSRYMKVYDKSKTLCIVYEPSTKQEASKKEQTTKRCDKSIFTHAAQVLERSPYFTDGHDHILTASHFRIAKQPSFLPSLFVKNVLRQVHQIVFENRNSTNLPDRLSFPSYLVGTPCATETKTTADLALIASLKPHDDRFRDRSNICAWISSSSSSNIRMPVCGAGDQCPSLAQSKYGFHVRGDTWGSQRLMDTLLSGTVPIFTSVNQYLVQPSWIDWTQLSELVNVSSKVVLLQDVHRILRDTTRYHQLIQNIHQHRHLFDWTTLYPFDTYMYMLQAHLYPETKHDPEKDKNPYTALRLP